MLEMKWKVEEIRFVYAACPLHSSRAVLNYSDVLSGHDTILHEQSKQSLKFILIFEDKMVHTDRRLPSSFLCSSWIGFSVTGQVLLLEVKDKREAKSDCRTQSSFPLTSEWKWNWEIKL
jgi:hypothetical protein